MRLSPETPLYINDLAWFLATAPQAELRNGAEAVKLAERARDLSGGKQARFWGILDAAYAETGRFPEALTTAARPDVAADWKVRAPGSEQLTRA